MVELGYIEVDSEKCIIGTRNKAMILCEDLGVDQTTATRIGSVVSETCHRCLQDIAVLRIKLAYIEKDYDRGIEVVYSPVKSEVELEYLKRFVDEFEVVEKGDGSYYVRTAIYFRTIAPFFDQNMITKLKDHIELKSREELLETIMMQNKALQEAKLRADAALESKTNFLANISHEIRTPINAISGMSYLLGESDIRGDQEECVENLQRSCHHLLSLVNDVLDLSKIGSGHMSLESVEFTTEALLKDVESMVCEKCSEKGLTLNFYVNDDVPRVLQGDSLRLGQILINYVNNAVKFTKEGHVDVRIMVISSDGQKIALRFEVEDTGIGIKEDQMDSLFQVFEQGDTTITREYGGTGLGLAISKELATLMDGNVGATSVYGNGSTFWFSAKLEIGERKLTELEESKSLTRSLAPNQISISAVKRRIRDKNRKGAKQGDCEDQKYLGKVLIVDDTELNLDILEAVLEDDYCVARAMNGIEALEILGDFSADLVLLDIMMPKMNGYDVIKRMRSSNRYKDIPVILLTAMADVESKTKGFEMGAVDYITKPFEIPEVKARVYTHISLSNAQKALTHRNINLQQEVMKRNQMLLKTQDATLESIASLAEYRDTETGGHIERTKHFVKRISQKLSELPKYREILSEDVIDMYFKSASMHDIGKIGICDDVLLKPGRLTPEEFEVMKEHTLIGYRVLASTSHKLGSNSFLEYATQFAKYHHERWDGKGYPDGLSGEAIPLPARIMAVVDVYDALRSKRVYKEAFSQEKTLEIIREGNGTQFDPVIVEAFMSITKELNQEYFE